MFILRHSGWTDVNLRNPDSGDIRRLTMNDIRRFTRSGTIKNYVDLDHWAEFKYYVYKFSALTNVIHDPPNAVTDLVITQLHDFLVHCAGLQITFIDRGTTRYGFITTPSVEIISERPNCTFDVNFEILETP
jgi:hypothetical protein